MVSPRRGRKSVALFRAQRGLPDEFQGLAPLASDYRPYGTQDCSTLRDSGLFNRFYT